VKQSFEITAASDDTLNDHVITLGAIQREIITTGNARRPGRRSSRRPADAGMPCRASEPFGYRFDQAIGDLQAAALNDGVKRDLFGDPIPLRVRGDVPSAGRR
jgi:hypothetical protein